jgi:hypothetical protein
MLDFSEDIHESEKAQSSQVSKQQFSENRQAALAVSWRERESSLQASCRGGIRQDKVSKQGVRNWQGAGHDRIGHRLEAPSAGEHVIPFSLPSLNLSQSH